MFVAIPTAIPDAPLTSRFGNCAGRTDRLVGRRGVVGPEVDRLVAQLAQELLGDRPQAALGVPHRGGRVAVDRAEVAVALDQGIPQAERLGHPDQGVVDRLVAVRVIALHHLADDRRALDEPAVGRDVQVVPHRVQDAALDRLEAVADVGQGPRRDHAQGVVEVARPGRLGQRDVLDHRLGPLARSTQAIQRSPVAFCHRSYFRGEDRIARTPGKLIGPGTTIPVSTTLAQNLVYKKIVSHARRHRCEAARPRPTCAGRPGPTRASARRVACPGDRSGARSGMTSPPRLNARGRMLFVHVRDRGAWGSAEPARFHVGGHGGPALAPECHGRLHSPPAVDPPRLRDDKAPSGSRRSGALASAGGPASNGDGGTVRRVSGLAGSQLSRHLQSK